MAHPFNDIPPPRLADRLLLWLCKAELVEEILGDLHEYYQIELKELPRWKARLFYWYHILNFLRPFALKRNHINPNFIMMYRNHFKFAWRSLLKHQANTFMNLLTLGLGIGCFIFIFIYLKGELSYDSFHKDADRIHRVVIDIVNSKGERLPDATTPPALAPALKRDFAEVESSVRIFPTWGGKFLLGTSEEQKYYEENVIRTDSTFFDVFSFPLLYGDAETALDQPTNVLISRKMALKYFGREDVVGENLTLFGNNNRQLQITGVLEDIPSNSHFHFDFLARIPFRNLENNWGWYNYYTYVKLAPNASIASLEPKLQGFFEGYQDDREPPYNIIYSQPLTDIYLKSNLKWELKANGDINNVYILSMLAIFVLIISCLNYLNLTVAESLKRFKEVGVRKVLGAQKQYLIGQFLAETLLITVFALGLGTLLAELMFDKMGDLLGRQVSIFDPQNLYFYLGISGIIILVGILAGLYPALHLSSFNPALAVKGLLNPSGKSALSLRRTLMVIQFSLSAFMIFCTIGVFRQLQHMKKTDKGFNAEQVMVIDNLQSVQNQQALKRDLMNIPGVNNVALSDGVVGGQNWTYQLGYPDPILVNYLVIDPEYIETMGFELVAGRNFSRERPRDTIGYNVILNETGMRDLGLSMDDVGKEIPLIADGDSISRGTIVGVLKDFHFADFKMEIKPFSFFYRETEQDYVNLQVSTANLSGTLRELEKTWSTFANNAPMEYAFIDETFAELHAKESRLSSILFFLTLLALFIAFMGMFASANIAIKARKKEISIRKVLGASVSNVTYMITRNFLWLVLIANIIAIPISFFVMQRWLENFAYRTSIGYTIFLITIASTLLVAVLTVGSQSFRAALSNPVNHLKQE